MRKQPFPGPNHFQPARNFTLDDINLSFSGKEQAGPGRLPREEAADVIDVKIYFHSFQVVGSMEFTTLAWRHVSWNTARKFV